MPRKKKTQEVLEEVILAPHVEQIEKRPVSELKPHPLNELIYGKYRPDEAFKKNIEENGIVTPILITKDGVIISGHRRYMTALELKSTNAEFEKVPVVVSDLEDDESIQKAIVLANVQRKKNWEHWGRELMVVNDIEENRALRRKQATQFGGTGGEILPTPEDKGKAIDIAVRDISFPRKGKTAGLLIRVIKSIDQSIRDGHTEIVSELREKLEKRSINKAFEYADENVELDEDVEATFRGEEASSRSGQPKFNSEASSGSIEWSKWSWNILTGCLHKCDYCYAYRMAQRFYPSNPEDGKEDYFTYRDKEERIVSGDKFRPIFYENRLEAPKYTKIPPKYKDDPAYKRVFVGSMTDIFGKWVSSDLIKKIFDKCVEYPAWTYIFLTKNPKRYAEFDIPSNCWLGCTVDVSGREKSAIEAFTEVKKKNPNVVTFVSCEPLRSELNFEHLKPVDWVIIGGFSNGSSIISHHHSDEPETDVEAFNKVTETVVREPKWEWVEKLLAQARRCGCKVYFKPNLKVRPKEHPEGEMPLQAVSADIRDKEVEKRLLSVDGIQKMLRDRVKAKRKKKEAQLIEIGL